MICQMMRDADDNKVSVCFCFMQEQIEDMERNAELGIIDLPFVMCLSAFQGSARHCDYRVHEETMNIMN